MLNARSVAIDRIPAEAYRPTFVRSLVMVPIRTEQPLGAIGNDWASHHRARPHEVELLESLAHSTAVALENVKLVQSLQAALADATTARDELQRQLELRDEFISAAAHELRTPVTTLELQMEALRRWMAAGEFRDHPRHEGLTRYWTVAARQVLDMRRLGENMLDASRIRLGLFFIQPTPDVDLGEVIRAAVADVRTNEHTPVQVEAVSAHGHWDRARLQQMVATLVDNAVKFGEGRPVHVLATVGGSSAHIAVRDEGIGIAQSDQQRIFDRFERAAPLTNFRGPGLGLFIARHIAEAHGGELSVQSTPGVGSTFTATIPLS